MGARIEGAGTDTIHIDGRRPAAAARRIRVLPDRIETGTYAMAVAAAGGDVLLQGAEPGLLQSALDAIAAAGAEVSETNAGIRVTPQRRGPRAGRCHAPSRFPAFRPICRRSSWR